MIVRLLNASNNLNSDPPTPPIPLGNAAILGRKLNSNRSLVPPKAQGEISHHICLTVT